MLEHSGVVIENKGRGRGRGGASRWEERVGYESSLH